MVLKVTLSYYANDGGSVFCTFPDAMKAFERVSYVKLFKLIVHRMLLQANVRFLPNMYSLVMSVASL